MIYKTLYRKRTIEQDEPTKNGDEFMCYGEVSTSCSTSDTRCKYVEYHPT